MAQTKDGALKVAAQLIGIPLEDYLAKLADGQKWCRNCKAFHPLEEFPIDRSRATGRASACSKSRATIHPPGWEPKPPINPATGKPGPAAGPGRDGDKLQARARVNVQVARGDRPHPNDLPCTDCGHVWKKGDPRHSYDHHLGYAAEHHLDVEPVCSKCHAIRDNPYRAKTHCKNGHPFTPENTIRTKKGRQCRTCTQAYDRKRRHANG